MNKDTLQQMEIAELRAEVELLQTLSIDQSELVVSLRDELEARPSGVWFAFAGLTGKELAGAVIKAVAVYAVFLGLIVALSA